MCSVSCDVLFCRGAKSCQNSRDMRPTFSGLRVTSRRALPGFTLIELLIVVVVASILMAIALPSYQNQIRKSRRADAVNAITAVQLAQEKYRASNTTYGT